MTNFRRWRFVSIPGLSLALCGVTALVWFWSYRVSDWITYRRAGPEQSPYRHTGLSVLSTRGSLVFRIESIRGANPGDSENEEWLWNLYHDDESGLRILHADSSDPWVDDDGQGVIDARVGSTPDVIATAQVFPISYSVVFVATFAPMMCGAFGFFRHRGQPGEQAK